MIDEADRDGDGEVNEEEFFRSGGVCWGLGGGRLHRAASGLGGGRRQTACRRGLTVGPPVGGVQPWVQGSEGGGSCLVITVNAPFPAASHHFGLCAELPLFLMPRRIMKKTSLF